MSLSALSIFLWGVIWASLVLSVVSDVKDRIIPDELVIAIAVAGLALRLTFSASEVWLNIAAASAVFVTLAIFCHYELVGGGDVKLVAAATLLVAPNSIGALLLEIALAGGLLSLFYLGAAYLIAIPGTARHLTAPSTAIDSQSWLETEQERIASGKAVPYALAIFSGLLFHFLMTSS